MSTEKKYKHLVLSGGGIKGLSHLAVLKSLIDNKFIDKIETLIGVSAGAIIGVFIVIGFSIDEVIDFILELDFKKLVKPDVLLFADKCGIETGLTIYKLLEEIITKKTGVKKITFKQLFDLTQINFRVLGTCLTTKECVIFDHENTPDMSVSMAIRISISIPGFFTPITLDDKKYIDGAAMNNYPIDLLADKIDDTIGILLCNEYDTTYSYPEQFFSAVINLLMHNYYKNSYNLFPDNTIYVKQKNKISSVNFEINNNIKKSILDSGYEAAAEFISKLKK